MTPYVITFIVMVGVFMIGCFAFKLPVGVSMLIAALCGALEGGLGTETIRMMVEGEFGYVDTILTRSRYTFQFYQKTKFIFTAVSQYSNTPDNSFLPEVFSVLETVPHSALFPTDSTNLPNSHSFSIFYFTISGFSSTTHGSPHLFSASIYGSGSNSSTLNTPAPFQVPSTTIMEPIIAGTPVV